MRKHVLGLMAATAIALPSVANAAITIGASGTTLGTNFSIAAPDNISSPNTVGFDTTANVAGSYTSYFEFSNDQTGFYNFALISSTLGATITLEQLMTGGGASTLYSSTGATNSLSLLTGVLNSGTTYRFTYTGGFPTGGGTTSGNASFYVAAVPEPATWGLMLIGFGGIGLAMRRRRRPALAQVA